MRAGNPSRAPRICDNPVAVASASTQIGKARDGWLFGPASDLLLGCGLGYVALFAALIWMATDRSNESIRILSPFIVILTGTPHYGATLLRVYEDASERRRYAFFAVGLTLAVWGLFYAGLYSGIIGSLLLTVYLTWSPWHYSGQNYGIALMFLRRRGADVTPLAKRMLHLSFTLSFVLTVLALHGAQTAEGEYAAVQPYQGGSFNLFQVGIPGAYWLFLFTTVGIAYGGVTLTAIVALLKRAPLRAIYPALILIAVQMLWFSVPPVARRWDIFGPAAFGKHGAAYAFMWVAAGHTVQYLWITTYYAARDKNAAGRGLYLAKALAAGSFIWSVPALLYSTTVEGGAWGGLARGPDVGVLLASAVNIHHFILDGAIWKLRDGRVARILIRNGGDDSLAAAPPRRRWIAPLVYAAGAVATAAVLGAATIKGFEMRPALQDSDLAGATRALSHLERLGHDEAGDYRRVAALAASMREYGAAQHSFEKSLEKHPSAITYVAMGEMLYKTGSLRAAVVAFQKAQELNPNNLDAWRNAGTIRLRYGDFRGAVDDLGRALELAPDIEPLQRAFERAQAGLAEAEAANAPGDGEPTPPSD
jgi:tetratricopeptide (TPR) repeat protein